MAVKIHPDARVFFDGYLGAIGINKKSQNSLKTRNDQQQFLLWLASKGVFSPSIRRIDREYFDELVKRGFIVSDNDSGVDDFESERTVFEKFVESTPKDRSKSPVLLSVCITNRCNLKCKHCANDSRPDSDSFLSFDDMKSIVDQAGEMGVMKLTLTGGEPLLHERIFDIIDYSSEKISRLGLTTNGYILDKRTAGKIKDRVDVVKISLDGLQRFHDSFRGSGSYERAINAIKMLSEYGIETRVQITLVRENRFEINELIQVLNGLGVKRITIVPVTPAGRAARDMMLSPAEYRAFISGVLDLLKGVELKSEVELRPLFTFVGKESLKGPLIIGNKYVCEALRSSLDILPNGDVIPCSFLHNVVGNVRKSSLMDIWESKESDRIRDLLNAVRNDARCRSCGYRELCEGGCVANAFAVNGKIGRDVYCWSKEAVK